MSLHISVERGMFKLYSEIVAIGAVMRIMDGFEQLSMQSLPVLQLWVSL